MDVVLGVSMAPSTVRMVLVEGENAEGVTVDEDDFDVDGGAATAPTAATVADRVAAAILGTREGAAEGGFALTSTGVAFSDQAQAATLRDALADRKISNVMLVSAFLAAAALAQTVGNLTRYARTGLLFVEPDTATLAVVDSADGSIAEVRQRPLPVDDDAALAELAAMVAGADGLETPPDGLFVVGSGVDVARIKPALEAATTLPVSAPEEPETALARGAALASAHAPLFVSSTRALAWARDPGTGEIDPDLIALEYAHVPADDDATQGEEALAYSAVPDGPDDDLLVFEPDQPGEGRPRHRPFLLTGSALATLFVVGVTALVISLAVGIRPTADLRPEPGQNIVVPTGQAPAPLPKAQQPAPAPPAATPKAIPQPVPQARPVSPAPPPEAPAPVPEATAPPPEAPAPPPEAPAPPPEAPAPAPVPVAPPPLPVAPVPVPVAPAPTPAPAAPPAPATPPAPRLPFPQLPSIFNPPKQQPPSQPGGSPGAGSLPGGGHGGFGGGGHRGGGGGGHGGFGGGFGGGLPGGSHGGFGGGHSGR